MMMMTAAMAPRLPRPFWVIDVNIDSAGGVLVVDNVAATAVLVGVALLLARDGVLVTALPPSFSSRTAASAVVVATVVGATSQCSPV